MKKFALIASVVYVLDVATKVIVRAKMPLGAEIPLTPFFSLVHVTNTGVAFGLFQGKNYLFAGLGLLLTFFWCGWLGATKPKNRF